MNLATNVPSLKRFTADMLNITALKSKIQIETLLNSIIVARSTHVKL